MDLKAGRDAKKDVEKKLRRPSGLLGYFSPSEKAIPKRKMF